MESVKRPYYDAHYQMWAVEFFTADGEFAGKNTNWCATENEAQASFNARIALGAVVVDDFYDEYDPQLEVRHFITEMPYAIIREAARLLHGEKIFESCTFPPVRQLLRDEGLLDADFRVTQKGRIFAHILG